MLSDGHEFGKNVIEKMIFATWMHFHRKLRYFNMELNSFLVFKGVDGKYIAMLEPLFEGFTCPAGTMVIEQGAVADYLYLIESGSVEIFYKPYDGETITVTHVGTGGLFGWSALVGSTRYSSSGVAMEKLSALRIQGSDLRNLCHENPQAGSVILDRLASAVSSRWQNAHEQVRSILETGLNS